MQINNYENKSFSGVTPNADSLIVTNGTEEYNITIEEFLKVHTNAFSHTSPSYIADLDDVIYNEGMYGPEINNGDVLIYDAGSMIWRNGSVPAPSISVADLDDVIISSIQEGDILIYSQGYGWLNGDLSIGVLNLADVSTHIGGPQSGQTLVFDGSYWVTDNLDITQLKNMSTGTPSAGDTIKYNGGIWLYEQLSTGGASELNDLDDVTITYPQHKKILIFNGSTSKWEDGGIEIADIGDVVIQPESLGDILTYIGTGPGEQWTNMSIIGALDGVGWSGTFSSGNGQQVTVSNGIIIDVDMPS